MFCVSFHPRPSFACDRGISIPFHKCAKENRRYPWIRRIRSISRRARIRNGDGLHFLSNKNISAIMPNCSWYFLTGFKHGLHLINWQIVSVFVNDRVTIRTYRSHVLNWIQDIPLPYGCQWTQMMDMYKSGDVDAIGSTKIKSTDTTDRTIVLNTNNACLWITFIPVYCNLG